MRSGRCGRHATLGERQTTAVRIHSDQVADSELTRQDLLGQRILQLLLNRPFQRSCTVDRVESRLAEVIDFPVVPKKGRRSDTQRAHEQDPRFIRLRRRHSAVESAINALEVHGLDRCPDHGIDGFKRYVALAVVGRNLHRLGAILLEQEAEQERRRRRRAA